MKQRAVPTSNLASASLFRLFGVAFVVAIASRFFVFVSVPEVPVATSPSGNKALSSLHSFHVSFQPT